MRAPSIHVRVATRSPSILILLAAVGLAGCTDPVTAPPTTTLDLQWNGLQAQANLDVVLVGLGFGLVKFRQPVDNELVVFLDTKLHLNPNTSYFLQRAVDAVVDNDCTSSTWLTLGLGPAAQAIVTDQRGKGDAVLWRTLAGPGNTFDIHFRVIDATTGAEVSHSKCYQFIVTR